jgi:hypothetical protein
MFLGVLFSLLMLASVFVKIRIKKIEKRKEVTEKNQA